MEGGKLGPMRSQVSDHPYLGDTHPAATVSGVSKRRGWASDNLNYNSGRCVGITGERPLDMTIHIQHAQSCLILCGPMDCSPPGFSVQGIFSRQEYRSGVAISSSRGSFPPRDRTHIYCISCTGRQVFYH